MKRIGLILTFLAGAALSAVAQEVPEKVDAAVAEEKGCLSCHEGIEKFTTGVMMETIEAMGPDYNDPAGCVVCHGGTPTGLTAEEAHAGTPAELAEAGGPHMFYPDPGALWIADKSCGQCHEGYAERLTKSLMNTEAGKLQGNLWSWGVIDTHRSVYGNYDLVDEDGNVPTVGTDAYKAYMVAFTEAHPDQMPDSMEQVPDVDVERDLRASKPGGHHLFAAAVSALPCRRDGP